MVESFVGCGGMIKKEEAERQGSETTVASDE
jgi:hypothetical protein